MDGFGLAEMPQIPFLVWYWFLGFEVVSWRVLRRRPAKGVAIRGMD
jgi:hypothetical protein